MNDISTRQGLVPLEHEQASKNQCYKKKKKKRKKDEALVTLTPHAPSQLPSCQAERGSQCCWAPRQRQCLDACSGTRWEKNTHLS